MTRDRRVTPGATYRVQLHPGFNFDDAAGIVEYLARLGITHLYCSPVLQAAPGSSHGYDVVDPTRLNEELGGSEGFDRLTAEAAAHGIGLIVDIVPNHMAIGVRSNPWWWDVLKHGPTSRYARCFDIDWDPPEAVLKRMILVPILGDHYGRVVKNGDLQLTPDEAEGVVVRYFDHELPLAPGSLDIPFEDANADHDALHGVLQRQHYRLAYWRAGDHDLNYRRFFDIKTLAGVRVEDPAVFEESHRVVLELARAGKIAGLRIDHIDGLRNPGGYLETLRERAADAYIVVEKILEGDESLPEDWPVEGTSGYDFLSWSTSFLVDPAGENPLTQTYESFTGATSGLAEQAFESKRFIVAEVLASDLERLTEAFVAVCERHPDYRDYTRSEVRAMLAVLAAAWPVYRTYVRSGSVLPAAKAVVAHAIHHALSMERSVDERLLEFAGEVIVLEHAGDAEERFVARWQQSTGPVMAKGVEDTVFYRYNRFVALNDVGCDPGSFGMTVDELHARAERALGAYPHSMCATSTHDTKRSEDVRARLSLLAQMPDQWADAVRRWGEMTATHKRDGWPERNLEYLFFQTIVGAWPLPADRAVPYMLKAAREAKVETSWTQPNERYESILQDYVNGALEDAGFTADVERFVRPLIEPGYIASMTMTLLKVMWPGVPDFYQGTEAWDLSLVDPDNRRPVDYEARRALLAQSATADAGTAWAARASGLAKLWLIQRALSLRHARVRPNAPYRPLRVRDDPAGRIAAFTRGDDIAVVVQRPSPDGSYGDQAVVLPPGGWIDELTRAQHEGGPTPVHDLFRGFPAALLAQPHSP
ncbi:MAG TPA: malto-oligosyltrehalose synthase [Actinomycetota bacterium]|nr:malto-oligosyltrehalose synthase [Actinomycetota bacterium]